MHLAGQSSLPAALLSSTAKHTREQLWIDHLPSCAALKTTSQRAECCCEEQRVRLHQQKVQDVRECESVIKHDVKYNKQHEVGCSMWPYSIELQRTGATPKVFLQHQIQEANLETDAAVLMLWLSDAGSTSPMLS
jgi:hypothetical protein